MPKFLKDFFTKNPGALTIRVLALFTGFVLVSTALGTYDAYMDDQRVKNLAMESGDGEEIETLNFTPFWLLLCHGVAGSFAIFAALFALAAGKSPWGQVLALFGVCLGIVIAWIPSDLASNLGSITISKVGEVPAPWTYFGQLILVSALVLSPPFFLWAYYSGPLMDRYLLGNVVTPLALCFFGFLAIWLIIDLTDNGGVFISSGAGLSLLGFYYLVQLPQMVIMVLPITLLLALLFALGKMSRANEIISMLGSGRSMGTVLKPVFIAGLYCSAICVVLNYQWAPRAEAHKEGILNQLEDAKKDKEKGRKKSKSHEEYAALGWTYRNSLESRTWFVGRVPVDLVNSPMRFVAVWGQDSGGGKMAFVFRADSATWDYKTGVWTFRKCSVWEYDKFGTARKSFFPVVTRDGWRETPWHVVSSSYKAEFLGIPGLTTYLNTNGALPDEKLAPYRTHWHFSWAEPLRCFFIVLMAAPLGIVHSRRGVLGGVATAIFIFFGLIFFDSVFLALAESGRMLSWVGAWAPNAILGVVGLGLFWFRANNKEIPKLKSLFAKPA